MRNNKNTKKFFSTVVVALIAFLLAAVIALGAAFLPEHVFGIDTTRFGTYRFDSETLDFIDKLETDITIYMILGEEASEPSFEYFFERLCKASPRLELVYKNRTDTDFLKAHELTEDVSAYTLVVESDKRYTVIGYSDTMVYSNSKLAFENISASDYAYYVSTYQYYYQLYASQGASTAQIQEIINSLMYDTLPFFKGEEAILSACEYVSLDTVPQIMFTEGNGEGAEESSILGSTLGNKNRIDLSACDSLSFKDISCLVINVPDIDLDDSETQKVLDFLKTGGRVLIITNSKNLEMKNLCRILSVYGLSSDGGIVCDGEGDKKTSSISVSANVNSDAVAGLDESGVKPEIKDANPIKMFTPSDGSLITSALFLSSENSYIDGKDTEKGVKTVAASAEESVGKETARLAWFTGGDTFNSAEYDEDSAESNMYAIVYALSWLNREYDSSVPTIEPEQYELLGLSISDGSVVILGVLLIAIIPASIGVVLFIRRYKRGKRVS